MTKEIWKTIEQNKDQYLEVLFTLLRQPSISSQNKGVVECAEVLHHMMKESGIHSRVMETDGLPVVYGEVIDPKNTFTLLIYGHYDVQPPEPLEKWVTPPFEPSIRNGRIYARGAGDNKGQLLANVLAIRLFLERHGSLPINVKFLFEGEEESGSPSLEAFVQKHRDLLKADLVYTSDGPLDSTGAPMILLGCRGMLSIELTLFGANHDNHSGNKGNLAPNPAWDLIHLLHSMRDPNGKVLIEGFYDDVRIPTDYELSLLKQIPFHEEEAAKVIGVEALHMTGEEYYRKLTLEPTFTINGLVSGYSGEGQKTIIPSQATVKFDMRLVADQDPDDILQKVIKHIEAYTDKYEINVNGKLFPSRTSPENPFVQKVIESVRTSRQADPIVLPAIGATFPDYIFTRVLKQPSILVPYANADEDNHAPNENMDVQLFLKGIETMYHVVKDLGEID